MVRGAISGGNFTGGPGTVSLRLSLYGAPLTLPLQRAQVSPAGVTADGWSGAGSRIGGAIAQSDIQTVVAPAAATAVRSAFAADCIVESLNSNCGCVSDSTGARMKNLFDKSPADCSISDSEVSSVVSGLLAPDIDLDSDGTNDAVSIGIGIHAVKGTFPPP